MNEEPRASVNLRVLRVSVVKLRPDSCTAPPDGNSVSATEFRVLEFTGLSGRAMPTTIRYTSADLEALPDDGRRYEIIDGELYVAKQPKYHHQYTCGRIHKFLDNWIDGGGDGRAIVAPGVIFTDDNDVVPDVVWISAAQLRSILGSDGHLHGAPEIAIEVLSTDSAKEGTSEAWFTFTNSIAVRRPSYSVK